MNKSLIIGTRGSDLALWQANFVKSALESAGYPCELKIIKTKGDEIQHLSFDKIEGKGFFTKEIEDALLKGEIDLAVHSHKDLETRQPEGLVIAAVSKRADPADLLIMHKAWADPAEHVPLKKGARVGTSSARRKALMHHFRKDLQLLDIRGNVPTRLEKLRKGDFDAILLAKAGVDRLGIDLSEFYSVVLAPEDFVPAPAQGVLALQCRAEDQKVAEALRTIHSAETQECIALERGVLEGMNGGCHLPLGVFARHEDDEFEVYVAVAQTWDGPLRHLTFTSNHGPALVELILREISFS